MNSLKLAGFYILSTSDFERGSAFIAGINRYAEEGVF
jgi:hypothetical protein